MFILRLRYINLVKIGHIRQIKLFPAGIFMSVLSLMKK
jgi:hypothetical protein